MATYRLSYDKGPSCFCRGEHYADGALFFRNTREEVRHFDWSFCVESDEEAVKRAKAIITAEKKSSDSEKISLNDSNAFTLIKFVEFDVKDLRSASEGRGRVSEDPARTK